MGGTVGTGDGYIDMDGRNDVVGKGDGASE